MRHYNSLEKNTFDLPCKDVTFKRLHYIYDIKNHMLHLSVCVNIELFCLNISTHVHHVISHDVSVIQQYQVIHHVCRDVERCHGKIYSEQHSTHGVTAVLLRSLFAPMFIM